MVDATVTSYRSLAGRKSLNNYLITSIYSLYFELKIQCIFVSIQQVYPVWRDAKGKKNPSCKLRPEVLLEIK